MIIDNYIIKKEYKALIILSLFHTLVIIASNYLVQFPFEIDLRLFKIITTPGAFTFPLIFLATDLTVRVFGTSLARKIIATVMIPALMLSYIISVIFTDGNFVGISYLKAFNVDIFRISAAGFSAYVLGQLLDITVFNRLRKLSRWWIAPLFATIAGSALDTFVFFFVAFFNANDAYMAEHWFGIGFIDYLTKLAISLTFMLPLYGLIVNYILIKIKNIVK